MLERYVALSSYDADAELSEIISDFESIIPDSAMNAGEDLLSGIGPDKLLSELFSAAFAKTSSKSDTSCPNFFLDKYFNVISICLT